jgi:hypothetical protein
MYDDDEIYGLTEIKWNREQNKILLVGFAFLGMALMCFIMFGIWFFFT